LNFPEKLDISEYIDEDCACKNGSKYSLFGIGNHSGDFNSGHFYSYIKLNDDKWYEFNDSRILPYTRAIENSSSAYILFYKKLNKDNDL
jgi:ubiquitin carboxyl-terminal hydrolase 4/11/15